MDRISLLKKYLDQACHNCLCYSKNYAMTEPKDEYKKEWQEARQEIEMLEQMIAHDNSKKEAVINVNITVDRQLNAEELKKRITKILKDEIANTISDCY